MTKRAMTVGELKELLADQPDELPILIPGSDHSYYEATARVGTALLEDASRGQWTEDYGEETTPEATYGTRLAVLIVSGG